MEDKEIKSVKFDVLISYLEVLMEEETTSYINKKQIEYIVKSLKDKEE